MLFAKPLLFALILLPTLTASADIRTKRDPDDPPYVNHSCDDTLGCESAAVFYVCRSAPSEPHQIQIKGYVTGVMRRQIGSDPSAVGDLTVTKDDASYRVEFMSGNLLEIRQYLNIAESRWVYTPMRAFMEGQTVDKLKIGGGFYFGLGRESSFSIGSDFYTVVCDFADQQPTQPE